MSETSQEQHQDHLALWSQFQRSEERTQYARSWLSMQCAWIGAAQLGLVVGRHETTYQPEAQWPADGARPERLTELVERVLAGKEGLVTQLPAEGGRTGYGIGYPVLVDDDLVGAVALELRPASEAVLREAMTQLQWGVSWLELWHRRQMGRRHSVDRKRLEDTVDLFATVIAESGVEAAATGFATELAAHTHSDRVSIGFAANRKVTVQAVSNTSHFTRKMNLNRAIAAAMEEAVTQRREVRFPQPEAGELLITRDHEELARLQGVACVMTVPLHGEGDYYGAITLERAAEKPFTDEEALYVRSVAALAGPALEGKRREARPLPMKVKDSCTAQIARLTGPGHMMRKVVVGGLLLAVLFLSFATGEYRLTADVQIEGAVLRAMVAPFDAYIAEADVRAGDIVAAGDVVARLDDRDLRLEHLRLVAQQSQLTRQLQEAMAAHKRVDVSIVGAQLEQAQAQIDLIESQLERTQIRAPFGGLVVEGDLTQRLGGSVQQGEVLFEVAPLDGYRAILQVDERRISDVAPEQSGQLVLAAIPGETFDFTVDKITPIATAEEGVNTFRVEATLLKGSSHLRPGMEGVAKIDIDRRKLVSIWTRDAAEWVKLTSWRYLP